MFQWNNACHCDFESCFARLPGRICYIKPVNSFYCAHLSRNSIHIHTLHHFPDRRCSPVAFFFHLISRIWQWYSFISPLYSNNRYVPTSLHHTSISMPTLRYEENSIRKNWLKSLSTAVSKMMQLLSWTKFKTQKINSNFITPQKSCNHNNERTSFLHSIDVNKFAMPPLITYKTCPSAERRRIQTL